jgi:hypothetical protein
MSITAERPTAFLMDWKSDHRELSDEQREQARRYICAIVDRALGAKRIGADEAEQQRVILWRRLRERYDGMAGSGRTAREDFGRSLAHI